MRCEGWVRHGGAFTLGPVTWKQCENTATVQLTVRQRHGAQGHNSGETGENEQSYPVCADCWNVAIAHKSISITEAKPLPSGEESDNGRTGQERAY